MAKARRAQRRIASQSKPDANAMKRAHDVASPTIVIVEDEPDIAELIRFHVDRDGYQSRVYTSGKVALEQIQKEHPTLVILDLMLPDLDGLEICRQLKWSDATRSIPIVIASAKGEEADVVTGLELGAEDYVTKPFSPKVLMARIRNVLRRIDDGPAAQQQDRRRISMAEGELLIDLDRHSVTVHGTVIDLTRTEFGILHCLASRRGFVRTRDQIIASVHGHNAILTGRTVDVHVTAIRKKLGDLSGMIQTVRGVGYRMDELPATVDA